MPEITERQQQLFTHILEAYMDDAEPVSSRFLVQEFGLQWSAATIRNEMAELEHAGFITHLHTSAGRIPTEKGWRYYLATHTDAATLATAESAALKKAAQQTHDEVQRIKEVAKAVAELAEQTMIVGFGPHDVYYTGITNLVRHPEFQDMNILAEMTALVDHCDDAVARMFHRASPEPTVLLGRENPFGAAAGTIITGFSNRSRVLLCLLGPMRMNYPKNIARIRAAQQLLS